MTTKINHSNLDILEEIKAHIVASGINNNAFYQTFKRSPLSLDKVRNIFQQYYYYIRTFPQILSGLAPRVDNELIRLKICRTVVSELGDGRGDPHFLMFEASLAGIGVSLDDYQNTNYIPEAVDLVDDLRRLFLKEDPNLAIGAHYVIEEFGLPMIINLYEGFRLYDGWRHEDFNYFYLHILIESNHVDWIQDAVIEAAKKGDTAREELLLGATQALESLTKFWGGLNRLAVE